jgi:hypothetical protein
VVVAQEVLELKRDKEFMQKANDALADLGDGIATLTGLQVSQLSLVQGRPTAARHQPPSFFFSLSLSLSLSFFLSLSLSLSLSLLLFLCVCCSTRRYFYVRRSQSSSARTKRRRRSRRTSECSHSRFCAARHMALGRAGAG